MSNRLATETSPYLLQHAENPVDWYPWGEEAFEKARAEDKPVFLSVGYSACHWCHVMEHESFEDAETAAFMNEHFVCVKVDREERPDVDAIYMEAVQALTGRGGWPMSVFLTPDAVPFYGGTYFPDTARYGMPSFIGRPDPARRPVGGRAETTCSRPARACGPSCCDSPHRGRRTRTARSRDARRRRPAARGLVRPRRTADGATRPSSRSRRSSSSSCVATSRPATRACSRWRRARSTR